MEKKEISRKDNIFFCLELLLYLVCMVGCYIYGWTLLNDTKDYYVSMLGNPASADPRPWSLIFSYAFMGVAPVVFSFLYILLLRDEEIFRLGCFWASFIWLIYFFFLMTKTFPMMFSLWGAAFFGVFWGIVIGGVLFFIFSIIIEIGFDFIIGYDSLGNW